MALILNIETATTACSICLAQGDKIIAVKERNEGYTHAENLTLFIQEVIEQSEFQLSDLDAIAVSMGPGSYTGLRIGVSTAKGLCYALTKPLIAINTLQHLALSVSGNERNKMDKEMFYCPMIDARRMEVYCAVYDNLNREVQPVEAKIISEDAFKELLTRQKVCFFGDGADKCKPILSLLPNVSFTDDVVLSAKSMVSLSNAAYRNEKFENLATFEPYYLKDFLIKKSKF